MKKLSSDLQRYIFTCIISADNDEFGLSEDDKQEIIKRCNLDCDWDYTLEPIKDDTQRNMLIEFFSHEID